MKMAGFLAAVLLMYSVSMGMAMLTVKATDELPLDMAPDSVDDMYDGCESKMEKDVKSKYLDNEKNSNENFKSALKKAGKYWKLKEKNPCLFLMAVYAYTLEEPNVYNDFNIAVRTQRSAYRTTFRYHSLHFYLTSALQKCNSNKPGNVNTEKCLTGYRRVDKPFSQNVLNKEIRFGSFTSSSLGDYLELDTFGDKSCFKIWTCFGAEISNYSKFGEAEREVLIPPYEVFKVTKIETRSHNKELPCEVVYEVKSTHETKSNLNCDLFKLSVK